nr:PREDICTED: nuclear hormone receptor family member nhr-85-like [Linepithema humile]
MTDKELTLLCEVCEDKAAGYHYGVFSCEGCKSFFGRMSNRQNTPRPCRNDNKCTIDKKSRKLCQTCRFQKCMKAGMSKKKSRFGRHSNLFKSELLLLAMLEALQKAPTENEYLYETYFIISNLLRKSIDTNEAIRNFQSIIERQRNSTINIQLSRELNPAESRCVADEREASFRDNVVTNDHPAAGNTLDLLVTLREFDLERMQESIQNQSIEQTEPLDLSVRDERHKLRTPSN